MAKKMTKKASEDKFLNEAFDFEKAVRAGAGGISKSTLKEAKAKAKAVDEARTKKVLKSVRYDAALLDQVRSLAKEEGVPYQTLMNSLLKTGLEIRKTNLVKRVERLERKLFKKHG